MSIASSAESGTAVNDNPVEMEGDSELHKVSLYNTLYWCT